jgi:hypothetical protein
MKREKIPDNYWLFPAKDCGQRLTPCFELVELAPILDPTYVRVKFNRLPSFSGRYALALPTTGPQVPDLATNLGPRSWREQPQRKRTGALYSR